MKVYIGCEDRAGWGLVDKIVGDLPDAMVILPPEGVKDRSALHCRDPKAVVATVKRMIDAAAPASMLAAERKRAEAAKASEAALRNCDVLSPIHI